MDKQLLALKCQLASIPKFDELGKLLSRMTLGNTIKRISDFVADGTKKKIGLLEKYSVYMDDSNDDIALRISELEAQYTLIKSQSTQERLGRVLIVATTIDTFLFRFHPSEFENGSPFHHIFLDEAGYCSAAKAAALFGFHSPVTLLGDHRQLPPVCELNAGELLQPGNENIFLFAQSALYLENTYTAGSTDELFAQYQADGPPKFDLLCKSDLLYTYRFGSKLADVLNLLVYQNGFCSALPQADFVIEVLDAPRVPSEKKRENPAEADIINARLKSLASSDYCILAPYRNQIDLLRSLIPEAAKSERILTVHASQGREWDTVFLSVVDTSDMYFMNSMRRELRGLEIINTAVSRARHRLIIACDRKFWEAKSDQFICELVRLS